MRAQRLAIFVSALVACANTPAARLIPAARAVAAPMSDPDEYRIARSSPAAGEAIFAHTGIGDPYRAGLAYPVFLGLQRGWPEVLGADMNALAARFGMIARDADPRSADPDAREGLPVGLHLTVDPITGVQFVVGNCSLCHSERLRWPGGERVVLGLGSRRIRAHAYDAAWSDLVARPDFSVQRVAMLASAAARERRVAWPSDWRSAVVSNTVEGMRTRARVRRSVIERTRDGAPGRVATIESFAWAMGQTLGREVATGATVGWARVPSVLGFGARRTLSWDGAGEGPIEVLAVEADFAVGVRLDWFRAHPLQGASLVAYLREPLEVPAFPAAIDRGLAREGAEVFGGACARCHGTYRDDGRVASYTERVVSVGVVGTDPARALAVSDDFVRAANDPSLSHGVLSTRRTGGYVPPVLTRVWARAPYGHAGQWSSLACMALAPDARPTRYAVDLDAPLDLDAVGVQTHAVQQTPGETVFDASAPGMSVGGHPYLAELSERERRAVIEYLKTL